ncbi:MAG: TRAP transporter small permease subunit [Gammaproteobacteria bacterium]|nr:TRAP transporter small permease subunit [Gammaproteobacteria bacterium]NIR84131.1 TRAP transporter small permease subunit [Gammaproteobacteria bacterium]NIR89443.1 TRAP transporter small permease subunit [Gammaproteobacteria bacterium]NIU05286.1 TRAP transporter small permease subunit [Gammaproteobacteria bacterium]NIV52226.1 TRAP transporter small permease subunit [Gammaproteobacteria bacterium]
MPKAVKVYVRYVDAVNRVVGRSIMYLVLLMMGVLLYASVSRTVFDTPLIWVVETAQFMLAAYYLLGGGYSLQLGSHVRMDLLYSRWSARRQAITDSVTVLLLIFYLVFLLIGGLSSVDYALKYGQRNYTPWAPPLAPIKIIMTIGIGLTLLQAIAILFKNVAKARGESLT